MTLHERLVDRQTTLEICRKQRKACRKGFWTQEDIDASRRLGRELRNRVLGFQQDALTALDYAMNHSIKQKRKATR